MTHLEKFIDLYKEFGIDIVVKEEEYKYTISLENSKKTRDKYSTLSKKFKGYGGFSSTVIFNKKGNFIKQCFWE